jgi:hypothetical protein
MSETVLTMAGDRRVDLLNIGPADIEFAVIAEHLAKTNRYADGTSGRARRRALASGRRKIRRRSPSRGLRALP